MSELIIKIKNETTGLCKKRFVRANDSYSTVFDAKMLVSYIDADGDKVVVQDADDFTIALSEDIRTFTVAQPSSWSRNARLRSGVSEREVLERHVALGVLYANNISTTPHILALLEKHSNDANAVLAQVQAPDDSVLKQRQAVEQLHLDFSNVRRVNQVLVEENYNVDACRERLMQWRNKDLLWALSKLETLPDTTDDLEHGKALSMLASLGFDNVDQCKDALKKTKSIEEAVVHLLDQKSSDQ